MIFVFIASHTAFLSAQRVDEIKWIECEGLQGSN